MFLKMTRLFTTIFNVCVYMCLLTILVSTVCCTHVGELISEPGPVHCLRFTDEEDYIVGSPEHLYASCSEQTIELRVLSTIYEHIPKPQSLDYLFIREWDSDREVFDTPYWETVNEPEDFYHVTIEKDNNGPLVKVYLKENDTNEERRVMICIGDYSDKSRKVNGCVILSQYQDYSKEEPFKLRAKYKGEIYESLVKLDSVGGFVYDNPEYKRIMADIDNNPSTQLVIMSDSMLNYYDDDDLASNQLIMDIKSLRTSGDLNVYTRASGFENLCSGDLGFMAIYGDADFKGKMISKGLTDFNLNYTVTNLKSISLNDKISSIAVFYGGEDSMICSVLTIWDDADYNHGDNDRKKHRLSFVATKNNPRITCSNLKNIKKIGSSKSWNDCLSSFIFHFGYTDNLLLDY